MSVEKNYDSIIIGSGAGGLTAAICLAKRGHKVLVLERHYVPGGWCHSFQLKGHSFSPGVHYIGQMGKNGLTRKLFEGLEIANDLVFFKMVNEGFEHCKIGNVEFDYSSDKNKFQQDLIKAFPHEKKGILSYLRVVDKVQKQLSKIILTRNQFQKIKTVLSSWTFMRHGFSTLESVVNKYIKDKDLRSVLNVQWGNHGVTPKNANFMYHSAVAGHYSNGGYYPMGGGASIVKSMTNVIKKYGGEIRTKTAVSQILVQDRRAYGVRLENGEEILAKNVVSNADPHVTYRSLLDRETIGNKLDKKLKNTKYSYTSLLLFVTLDADLLELGLNSGNYWISENNDFNNLIKYSSIDEVVNGDKFPMTFISSSTLKDPSSFNGTHYNLEMVTFIDTGIFDTVEDYSPKAYLKIKQKIAEKFLGNLEQIVPNCREHVVQMELGTPKSNKHYINATKGNVYGIQKTLSQLGSGSFQIKSEIENLFLCGSSTLSHGVAGAMNSGTLAAAEILDCEVPDLMENELEQELRVYNIDDPSTWPDWLNEKIAFRKRKMKVITPSEFLVHQDPNFKSQIA